MSKLYVLSFCPYCKKPISFYKASKIQSIIGKPEIYTCSYCNGKISNGLKEWKQLDNAEKIWEVLSFIIAGLIFPAGISFMIFSWISYLIFEKINVSIIVGIIFTVIYVVLAIFSFINKIEESNKRFNKLSKNS